MRAHTNIALIKYWGKKNEQLIIPTTSSLSLTLDAFYTDTCVRFDERLKEDSFYLDGEKQRGAALRNTLPILSAVRKQARLPYFAEIVSSNHVPTAAGLASSASGMAALAGAASLAAGLRLSPTDLSRLARRGSGSASRSIYGGFVEWQKGQSDQSSFALPVREADFDVGMVFLLLNQQKKEVSSREGMQRTVTTSPFYPAWVEHSERDLIEMKQALYEENFEKIGMLTEQSAMRMHATTMGAVPPFTYFEPATLEAMHFIRQLRKEGILCYYTMDAGPNVKILCRYSDSETIRKKAATLFGEENCIVSKPGSGLMVKKETGSETQFISYQNWITQEEHHDKSTSTR